MSFNTDLPKPPVLSSDVPEEAKWTLVAKWIDEHHQRVQQILDDLSRNVQQVNQPYQTAVVTVADITAGKVSAAKEGLAVTVKDEVGGSVLAVSDGAAFRRTTDRAIVS
jgi:hypothetical protein